MVAIIINLKIIIQPTNISQFILLILAGAISYFSIAYLFDKFFNYGMQKLYKENLTLKEN
jgi:hypothetical protein